MARISKSRKKFDRINELNKIIDTTPNNEMRLQAKATKRDLPNSWGKRTMNPGDTFNKKNSKPSACVIKKG